MQSPSPSQAENVLLVIFHFYFAKSYALLHLLKSELEVGC